jgi:hypothetical protein
MRPQVIILLALVLAAPTARACYCFGDQTLLVQGDARAAAAVFVGRVISVSQRLVPLASPNSQTVEYDVILRPTRSWKGLRRPAVKIVVGIRECDMGFEVGVEYVVVANRSGKDLTANRCSSARIEDGAGIIAALEAWRRPRKSSRKVTGRLTSALQRTSARRLLLLLHVPSVGRSR